MAGRKLCIVTGTRADYGLLYWLAHDIEREPDLTLQLVVTGAHLSQAHGHTVDQITRDGFRIAATVDLGLDGDERAVIVQAMARGLAGFGAAFSKLEPDIVVVVGDRYEILVAATAAVTLGIPIAHIHGGERSEGAFDELIRHAITKLSHFHFPAAESYARRIRQMGEDPARIFLCGAPGLEHIDRTHLTPRPEVLRRLGIKDTGQPLGLITYHPVTFADDYGLAELRSVFAAIKSFEQITWIASYPNADPSHGAIGREIAQSMRSLGARGKCYASMASSDYLSLLRHAVILVGNSSSGIIEAPSFGTPVVNIGYRQRGRVRAANIIDVDPATTDAIVSAMKSALSPEFEATARACENPFYQPRTSKCILDTLRAVDLSADEMRKKFVDIETEGLLV